jgi:hypothetical protein
MNEDNHDIDAIASAWQVETVDLTARVAAAIGSAEPSIRDLLSELRALRQDVTELRRTTASLQDEVWRLRQDLSRRPTTRIAPFAPTEGLVRLS